MARYEDTGEALVDFGRRAKETVLTREAAHELADAHGIYLEGLTGQRIGVIGALAAVGLRRGGHDGRFIWLEGVRELTGTAVAGRLLETTGIDSVETIEGEPLPADAEITVDPWPRPVLLNGRAVLLAERNGSEDGCNG
jgi:hypothetical protein